MKHVEKVKVTHLMIYRTIEYFKGKKVTYKVLSQFHDVKDILFIEKDKFKIDGYKYAFGYKLETGGFFDLQKNFYHTKEEIEKYLDVKYEEYNGTIKKLVKR